jgi:hypothetical protein
LLGKFIQVSFKIWRRITGIEPRQLYRQLTETQTQLTETQTQLTETQTQLTETQTQLTIAADRRDRRVHPYIIEALELVAPDKNLLKTEFLLENKPSAFTEFGSDKDTRHSYGSLYFELLREFNNPRILEIGVGSVNDFPYAGLPPGGALKAFRKEFQNAKIIGLDVDPDSIEKIKEQGFMGFVVDQTSDESLNNAKKFLTENGPFDLIIDDGFHDPHANIRTLKKLFNLLSDHGTYVIEDIHETLIPFWNVIATHLPGNVRILDLRRMRPETEDNILILITKA